VFQLLGSCWSFRLGRLFTGKGRGCKVQSS